MVEIFVGGKSARGSRAAFEQRHREIARLGLDPLGVLAHPVPSRTVAPDAVATILLFSRGRVPVQLSAVAHLSGQRRCGGDAKSGAQFPRQLLLRSSEPHDEPPGLRRQNRAQTTTNAPRRACPSTAAAIPLPRHSQVPRRESSPSRTRCAKPAPHGWSSWGTSGSRTCTRRCSPGCSALKEAPAATSG